MSNENRVKLTDDQKAKAEAQARRYAQAGLRPRLVKDGNGLQVMRTPGIFQEPGPSRRRRAAVCAAIDPGADLWITPEDEDDLIIALIEMFTETEMEMKGWIAVRDGRRLGYKIGQDVFVPQFHLNDPSLLQFARG
jgi:hypothetical protein